MRTGTPRSTTRRRPSPATAAQKAAALRPCPLRPERRHPPRPRSIVAARDRAPEERHDARRMAERATCAIVPYPADGFRTVGFTLKYQYKDILGYDALAAPEQDEGGSARRPAGVCLRAARRSRHAGWSTSATRARRSNATALRTRSAPSRGARTAALSARAHDAVACLDTADDREALRGSATAASSSKSSPNPRSSSVAPSASGTRIEVEHAANAGAARDVRGVDADAVRDVQQRVCASRRAAALPRAASAAARSAARGTPRRRRRAGPVTTSRSPGRAPARPGTRCAVAERRHRDHDRRPRVVSPPTTGTPASAIPS